MFVEKAASRAAAIQHQHARQDSLIGKYLCPIFMVFWECFVNRPLPLTLNHIFEFRSAIDISTLL